MVQTKQALTFVAVTGPLPSPCDQSPRLLIPSAGSRTQNRPPAHPQGQKPLPLQAKRATSRAGGLASLGGGGLPCRRGARLGLLQPAMGDAMCSNITPLSLWDLGLEEACFRPDAISFDPGWSLKVAQWEQYT